MTVAGKPGALQGTIFKKCDMAACRPQSRKDCKAGACQHTCADVGRCSHKWTLRYSVNGRQREQSFADQVSKATGRVSYGSGRKLAEDAQLRLTHGKRAGDAVFADRKAGSEDFCAAVEAFIDANRKAREQSKRIYRGNHRANVRPVFAGRTLAQVAVMRAEVDKLLNETMGGMSTEVRRNVRRLIVGTLDAAVAAGKVTRHQCAGIELAKPEVTEEDHEEAGFVHLTDAQVRTLAEGGTFPGGDGKRARKVRGAGLVVWLQRTMGLRVSEALGLEKSDFQVSQDGKSVTLRLRWQSSRDGRKRVALKHREPGQGRDIPVPAFTWAMVKDLPDGPLFPGTSTRFVTYATVHSRFARLTRAMGIEGFTTHSLRHLYATEAVAGGMHVANLSKVLGHSHPSITYRYYVHETADYMDDARARMDARWGLGLAA